MHHRFTQLSRLARKVRAFTFACAVLPAMQCGDLAQAIRDLGFQEIIPPTTFAGPGAVIYIRDTHPLRTGVICPPEESLGPNFQPRESDTQQNQFSKTRKRHFAIGADLLSQIKTDIQFHAVRTITVTLTHPKIFLVADTDVLNHMSERTDVCKRAIKRRQEANQFRISMISETLQGDVTYSVVWENFQSVSAEAKVDILTNLMARLKVSHGDIRGNSIVGKALVWGIVEDRWLAESANQPEAVVVNEGLQAVPLQSISDADQAHLSVEVEP